MKYTVVYIEESFVAEPVVGKVFAIGHDTGIQRLTLTPCRTREHKLRVSQRDFSTRKFAQQYADSIAPSRKPFVIELPKEHRT